MSRIITLRLIVNLVIVLLVPILVVTSLNCHGLLLQYILHFKQFFLHLMHLHLLILTLFLQFIDFIFFLLDSWLTIRLYHVSITSKHLVLLISKLFSLLFTKLIYFLLLLTQKVPLSVVLLFFLKNYTFHKRLLFVSEFHCISIIKLYTILLMPVFRYRIYFVCRVIIRVYHYLVLLEPLSLEVMVNILMGRHSLVVVYHFEMFVVLYRLIINSILVLPLKCWGSCLIYI